MRRRRRCGRLLGLAGGISLLAALVPALAPATAPGAASRATGQVSCHAAADPYRLPEGALARCGVRYYPLLRTYRPRGGGTAYVYRIGDTLTRYYARSTQDVTPGPFIATVPASVAAPIRRGSWGGYHTYSLHNRYHSVGALWTEPHFRPSHCNSAADAFWVGLGGVGQSETLVQDGTMFGAPGIGPHQAFYEIVSNTPGGSIPATPVRGLYATPGQGFTASVSVVRSTRFATEYRFRMHNLHTGRSADFTQTVPGGWPGKHADVEAEWLFRTGSDMGNFGTVHFADAETDGKAFGSLPRVEDEIFDRHVLAETSELSGKTNFTVTAHRCGP